MTTAQQTANQALVMSPAEALQRMRAGERVLILDVRAPREWEASPVKIQGALRVEPDHPHFDPGWPKEGVLLVYCDCAQEYTSSRVARQLREQGYAEAYALQGGVESWRESGGSVEPK